MSFNVGSAEGSFYLKGLRQSLEDLIDFKDEMIRLEGTYKRNRSAQARTIKEWKQLSPAINRAVGDTKTFKRALESTNAAIAKHNAKLQAMARWQNILASKRARGASGFSGLIQSEQGLATRRAIESSQSARASSGFGTFAALEKQLKTLPSELRNVEAYSEKLRSSFESNLKVTKYNAFNTFKEIQREHRNMVNSMASFSMNDPLSRMASGEVFRGASERIGQFAGKAQRSFRNTKEAFSPFLASLRDFNGTVKKSIPLTNTWFQRFGLVAGGFWIAYRAINAVEFAISNLTNTFAGGLKIIDEYREGTAEISGMLGLLSSGRTFDDRFVEFNKVMAGTMQEVVRLSPKYRLSVEEVSTGIRELAQFGVVVSKDMVPDTLNMFAMIRSIAQTTGSSAKQIRQEIQAMFSGSARVTDQFARMVKITMPDLFAQLSDMGISTQEKWAILSERFEDFQAVYERMNATVMGQTRILGINLSIVSQKALEASGIYEKWMNTIKGVNEGLFQKGELTDFGQRLLGIFQKVWQFLDGVVESFKSAGRFASQVFSAIQNMPQKFKDIVSETGKWYVRLAAINVMVVTLRVGIASLFIPLKAVTGLFVFAGNVIKTIVKGIAAFSLLLTGAGASFAGPLIVASGSIFIILNTLGDIGRVAGNIAGVFVGWGRIVSEFVSSGMDYLLDKLWNAKERAKEIFNPFHKADIRKTVMPGLEDYKLILLDATKEYEDLVGGSIENVLGKAGDLVKSGFGSTWEAFKSAFTESKLGQFLVEKLGSIDGFLAKIKEHFNFDLKMPGAEELAAAFPGWLEMLQDHTKEVAQKSFEGMQSVIREFAQMGMGELDRSIFESATKIADLRVQLDEALRNKEITEGYYKDSNRFLDDYLSKMVQAARENQKISDIIKGRVLLEERLSDVDQDFNFALIDRKQKLKDQIGIHQQILASQKLERDLLIKTGQDSSTATQQIRETLRTLRELKYELYTEVGSGVEGFILGLKKYSQEIESTFQLWQRAAQDTASGMESAFETYFFDAMQGRFESFKDYFIGFLESIQKALSKLLAEQVTGQIVGGIAGAFGGGGGLSPQGGMVGSVPEGSFMTRPGGPIMQAQNPFASGGWIKEPVFGVGLNSGESYSFAEKRPEYVNAGPSGANVQVNVINQTGQPVEASQGKTRFDGKKFIVDVVMDDVNRGGRLRGLFGR